MKNSGKRFDTTEFRVARHEQVKKRLDKRRERKERISKVPKWFYKVVIILLFAVAGMLLWFNRENLAPANLMDWVQTRVVGLGVGDGFPHHFDGVIREDNFVCTSDRNVAMVSDTALRVINSTGKELLARQHSFNRPVMKTAGTRTLIYNLGGTGYQLESMSNTLVKASTEQNILSGSVAQNGSYALLTLAEGYCGKLTAYKPDGKEKYYYLFSDYYPTSVAISPDGSKAIVTAISAKGGGMVSAIYLLDFNKSEQTAPLAEYQEGMLLDSYFCSGGTAVAVGDKLTAVVNAATLEKVDFDYGGKTLGCSAAADGYTVLSLMPYENAESSALVFLDASGKVGAQVTVEGAVRSVSLYGQTASALASGKLHTYSVADGSPAGVGEAGQDARAAVLSSETRAYVLGISEVRSIAVS